MLTIGSFKPQWTSQIHKIADISQVISILRIITRKGSGKWGISDSSPPSKIPVEDVGCALCRRRARQAAAPWSRRRGVELEEA
jgi:hypothetical protein